MSPGEKRDVVALGDLNRSLLRPQIGLAGHIASERHPSSRCRNLDLYRKDVARGRPYRHLGGGEVHEWRWRRGALKRDQTTKSYKNLKLLDNLSLLSRLDCTKLSQSYNHLAVQPIMSNTSTISYLSEFRYQRTRVYELRRG